jgi:putative phosphoribosyl transferase
MYFASRLQAGRMLAELLLPKYRFENCAVLALDDGGVMVGAQIAKSLHCVLTLLSSAEIMLPREPEPVAGITSNGVVIANSHYSDGELAEFNTEYFNYIEQEKLRLMHEMNRLQTGEGTVDKSLLAGRHVIVVSDGLKTGFQVDLAAAFLKPVAIEGMVMAVPFASVNAVDRMHVLADALYCMNVLPEYRDTNHYYDKQDVPDHKTITDTIENIILEWK